MIDCKIVLRVYFIPGGLCPDFSCFRTIGTLPISIGIVPIMQLVFCYRDVCKIFILILFPDSGYTNWYGSEPDHNGGHNYMCALGSHDWQWFDTFSDFDSDNMYYLCEI